jgi:hypothetical protein
MFIVLLCYNLHIINLKCNMGGLFIIYVEGFSTEIQAGSSLSDL